MMMFLKQSIHVEVVVAFLGVWRKLCRVALWQSRRPRLMSVPFFWRQSPQRMPCLRLDLQRDFWELLREKLYIEELYCGVPRRRRREVSSQQTMLYQHGIIESVLRANTWFSFFEWNSDLENEAQVFKLFFFFYSKDWKKHLIQHNINISKLPNILFVLQVIHNSTCSTQLNVLSQWNRHKTYHSIICVLI